ncbi:DUF6151 family protein [Parerythrobacter aestuarii]|uniref:DUF6151 family protein n=1 Tax=Parerythrobacter aestuarii TaxID=3020909 RepID=UPI0024DE2D8E|nr:DUF6151 family protein [Parerythrobacter aestuarii]
MTADLHFACKCGAVAGKVEHADCKQGDHVVCHCTDCRDLVRHFGQESRFLDDHDGTALYQSRCARLQIDRGLDELAGLHMTDAPTLRWYARCCGTPMFNTYKNGRLPYVTTLLGNCDVESRLRLGDPLGHLFLKDAKGDTSGLPELTMSRLLRRFFTRMIKDIASGDRRRNPLFDAKTLEPVIKPRHLTFEEQQALGRA